MNQQPVSPACHSCFFKASLSMTLDYRQKTAQFRFKEQPHKNAYGVDIHKQQFEVVPLYCSSTRLPAEGSGGQSCLRRGGGGGWKAKGGKASARGEEADRLAAQLWLPAPCEPLQWFSRQQGALQPVGAKLRAARGKCSV